MVGGEDGGLLSTTDVTIDELSVIRSEVGSFSAGDSWIAAIGVTTGEVT